MNESIISNSKLTKGGVNVQVEGSTVFLSVWNESSQGSMQVRIPLNSEKARELGDVINQALAESKAASQKSEEAKERRKFFVLCDPCNIVAQDDWSRFLDVTDFGNDSPEDFPVEGGKVIECSFTENGDGFMVINRVSVPVDAGLVCIAEFDEKPKGRWLWTNNREQAQMWFERLRKI